MNQQTIEEFKTEYDKALFKMHSASGRKEAVYWCHRATELKQAMINYERTMETYC